LRTIIRTFHALRGRLAIVAGASILSAVALFGVATVLIVDHRLHATLDSDLRQRAEDVARLAVLAPAVLRQPGALESPVSGREISVEVLDARGTPIARSLSLGAELLPVDQLARAALHKGASGYEEISLGGRPFQLFAAPIAAAGGPAAGGAVLVASDTSDIDSTVHDLGLALVLSGLGAAVVAAILAAALTRRGLAPLRKLADAAAEIERTADPTRRLPDVRAGDEVGELTGVLNRMLAALERARAGERRFLADASHELRTPVTSLLGNVQYAAQRGADAELLADLRRDAERLARLVDDLLVLERAGADERGPDAAVALDALVRELVGSFGHDRERVAVGELEPVFAWVEPEEISRALRNLIDNALVHGPADGTVAVSVRAVDGRALVTVSDEGEGPDPGDLEHLFERFWRGPGASGRPGSGLGLAIVAAIAERHGGRVVVDGSAFTLELPAGAGR
jgi:two-component system sensor histidine kinase MprB